MKKILFAINKLGIGGAETVVVNQVNALAKFDEYDIYLGILYATTQTNTLYHKLIIDQDRIVHFNFSKLFDIAAFWRVYRFLKDEKIDIVSSNLFESNTVIRVAALLAGTPVVVITEHSNYVGKKWWQKKTDWLLSFCTDCIFGVSQAVVDFTSEQEHISLKKFKVLDQISDFSIQNTFTRHGLRENLGIPQDAFVAMTVGRLSPEKAQYRIIDAADTIVHKEQRTNIYFLIVGYGPLEQALRESVIQKNLEKHVKIIVDPKQAKEYLVAGDVFLLPSDREGMPVALLEAMYNGLPAIASHVGGVPDVLRYGGGVLINVGDVTALAEKVIELHNHLDMLNMMSGQSKTIATKFTGSISAFTRIIEDVYNLK